MERGNRKWLVQSLRGFADPKTLLLAGYLMLPNFQPDDSRFDWLPLGTGTIKYGVVLAVLAALLHSAYQRGPNDRRGFLWALLFGLLLLLPLGWHLFGASIGDYGEQKIEKLFELTVLTLVAPFFFFRSDSDLKRFNWALALAGMVYGASALMSFFSGNNVAYRLTAMNSNPITIGRAAGISLIWFSLLGFSGRMRALPATLVSVLSLILVLGSGSRGPLLSSLFAIWLCYALFYRSRISKKKIAIALTAASLAIVVLANLDLNLPMIPLQRISSFFQGEFGQSEMARAEAFDLTLAQIVTHPLGIGWGGFDEKINLWRDGDRLSYPHNLYLEIFLEAGWVAGLALLWLTWKALANAYRCSQTPDRIVVLGLLAYFLGNSMVSGDINSNRIVLCFMMLALCLPKIRPEVTSPASP